MNTTEQIPCIAHIRNNTTGEVRRYETVEFRRAVEQHPDTLNWSEGNYGCDCNRRLFFGYAGGSPVEYVFPSNECSTGEFSVNLEIAATGEIYYREF